MNNSGKYLVLALVGSAILLGIIAWWQRYEAAYRVTQFWGSAASRLIAESDGFEVIKLVDRGLEAKPTDLSTVRGQAHLRHALMSDSNYLWDQALPAASIQWHWTLRFYEGEQQAEVQLSEDLGAIGKLDSATGSVTAFSCQPMTEALRQYFQAVGLIEH